MENLLMFVVLSIVVTFLLWKVSILKESLDRKSELIRYMFNLYREDSHLLRRHIETDIDLINNIDNALGAMIRMAYMLEDHENILDKMKKV